MTTGEKVAKVWIEMAKSALMWYGADDGKCTKYADEMTNRYIERFCPHSLDAREIQHRLD